MSSDGDCKRPRRQNQSEDASDCCSEGPCENSRAQLDENIAENTFHGGVVRHHDHPSLPDDEAVYYAYDSGVEGSLHVDGSSEPNWDDIVEEAPAREEAEESQETNAGESVEESYSSESDDTDDDEIDDHLHFYMMEIFWIIAGCLTEEAWARAQDCGVPLGGSIATLLVAGAGLLDESD